MKRTFMTSGPGLIKGIQYNKSAHVKHTMLNTTFLLKSYFPHESHHGILPI